MSCNRQVHSWRSTGWTQAILTSGLALLLLISLATIASEAAAQAPDRASTAAFVVENEESALCEWLRKIGLPCDSDSSNSDGGGA